MKSCPICNSNAKLLFELPMANFDHSKLYKTIQLMSCIYCGHVFNNIEDVNALKQYYNEEYRDFKSSDDKRKFDEVIYDVDNLFNDCTDSHEFLQRLEHSTNPVKILKQLSESMVKGETLAISIPDASRYQETEPFNFYWLSLREHVQHFDINHILMLAEMCKFELVEYTPNEYDIVGKYKMPNLDITLRYNPETKVKYRKNLFDLQFKMMNYIYKQEKLREEKCNRIAKLQYPIFWGISREFMYAYENLGLKNYNSILVDDTPIKQQKYTVDRKPILSSEILKDAPAESCLIITAIAHKEVLMQKAREIGYKGEIIEL